MTTKRLLLLGALVSVFSAGVVESAKAGWSFDPVPNTLPGISARPMRWKLVTTPDGILYCVRVPFDCEVVGRPLPGTFFAAPLTGATSSVVNAPVGF